MCFFCFCFSGLRGGSLFLFSKCDKKQQREVAMRFIKLYIVYEGYCVWTNMCEGFEASGATEGPSLPLGKSKGAVLLGTVLLFLHGGQHGGESKGVQSEGPYSALSCTHIMCLKAGGRTRSRAECMRSMSPSLPIAV